MPKNPSRDDDHEPNANSLIEKIAALQERAKSEGFISDGKDRKLMMDAAWGEPEP